MARGQRRAFEVDREYLVPDREIDVDQRRVAAEPEHPGGVHQIVEPPGGLAAPGQRRGDGLLGAEVAPDIMGARREIGRRRLDVEQRRSRARAD